MKKTMLVWGLVWWICAGGAWAQGVSPAVGKEGGARRLSHIPAVRTGVERLQKEGKWRPTGARRADAETVARTSGLMKAFVPKVKARDLPSGVKNLTYLPAVYRQTFGSCAAFAVTYYHKTYQEAREHGWVRPDPSVNPERVMSPAFTYNLANGGSDDGSAFQSNYGYLIDYGAATCATMDPNADWRYWPTEAQWRDGHRQRAASFSAINITTAEGLTALKQLLAGGDIGTFGMLLHNNFVSYPAETAGVRDEVLFAPGGGVYDPPGDYNANHALTVVGYDDNKVYRDDGGTTHTGAFLVVNSWGTSFGMVEPDFGTGGFIWISYDYFQTQTWGEVYAMEDRIGWNPDTFLVYDFNHDRVAEMYLELLMGNKDTPLYRREVLPRQGGVRGLSARVVVDISDYRDHPVFSYWLNIGDVDVPSLWSPAATGWITYAAVEKPGQEPWVCPETPIQTIEVNIELRYLYANMSILDPGEAAFEGIEAGEGMLTWADVDQDGAPDVVFSRYDSSGYKTVLFRNDGAGNFMQSESRLPNTCLPWGFGDLNNDGFPDIAVNSYNYDTSVFSNEVCVNTGNGMFARQSLPIPAGAHRFAWVDYDNDGDQDLAYYATHDAGEGYYVRILRNDGGALTDSGVDISPVESLGRMAWADYDRDGWMDVLICTGLYRNTGGAFELATTLPSEYYYAMAWGDYNNDGWLDLATRTSVLRNNGDGTFTTVFSGLPSTFFGSFQWADIDNDGYADLLLTGDQLVLGGSLDVSKTSAVYRNNVGDGTFTDMGLPLPDVSSAALNHGDGYLTAVDVDKDGDLDLCIYGGGEKPYPLKRYSRIYRNRIAGSGGDGRPNGAPTPPTAMATEAATGDRVVLKWSGASDAETSGTGLYYNVRAGWNPGGSDLISCSEWPPTVGGRLRPTLNGTEWGVSLPKPSGNRPFFWSVQSVDAGLRGSAWSESKLYAPAGVLPGDVNQDGELGAGDLLLTIRMAQGALSPDLARADRNGDGVVNNIDVLFMRRILQQESMPDGQLIEVGRIGPEGGTLHVEGFTLEVPAGAFSAVADLTLRRVSGDRPFDSGSVSPMYYLGGLPNSFAQTLTVRIDADAQQPGGTTGLGVSSEEVFGASGGVRKWTYLLWPATTSDRLTFRFEIPATEFSSSSEEITIGLSVLTGYKSHMSTAGGLRDGGHFSIYYPSSVDDEDAANLGNYLEIAYNKFRDSYGFNYHRRTRWPVTVTVKDLGAGVYGYYYNSKLGNNYGYMEFNSSTVNNAEEMRVTAGHEFFHLVQSLYDNRNRFSKAVGPGKQFWVDEATAVWSEKGFSTNPDYVSSIFAGTQFDIFFDGMHVEDGTAGPHGYGMAPLIQYLVTRQGNTFPSDLYDDLFAGKHPVEAVCKNSPNLVPFLWYSQFVGSYICNELGPFKLSDSDLAVIATAGRTWKLTQATDLEQSRLLGATVTDLGAILFKFDNNSISIPSGASLYAGLVSEEEGSLSALKWKGAERSWLTMANLVRPTVYKLEVGDLPQYTSTGAKILLNVVNDRKKAPYNGKQAYSVRMAVLQDRTLPLTPQAITTGLVDSGDQFPTFDDSGTMSCRGLVDVRDYGSAGFHWFWGSALGASARELTIDYTATARSNSITEPLFEGDYYLYTFLGVDSYEFDWGAEMEQSTISSATGHFSLTLEPEKMWYSGTIYIKYRILKQFYDASADTLSDVSTNSWDAAALLVILEQE